MKNFAFYAKAQPSIGIAKIVFNYLLSRYTNKRFGDVCETTSGGTPNRGNADFYNGDIPWLKSGELNDGLITEYEETITALGLKNSSAKVFPKDTLVVAMYGATAGKTGVLNFDAATNQAVCAVFPSERIRRDFVFWYLKQQRVDFIEISRGGAQPNISQTVIKNAIIPCPDLETQDMVVAFLDNVDAGSNYQIPDSLQAISREVDNLLLIRSRFEAANSELNAQSDYLTQLRQALLREAMQGRLLPQHPTDEPAAVLLQQLQAAKAKSAKAGKRPAAPLFAEEAEPVEGPFAIPASWVWCTFSSCSINFDGQRKPIALADRIKRERIYDYYGASGVIDQIDGFTHEGEFLLIGEDGANLVSRSTPIAFIASGRFWVNNHAHVIGTHDRVTLDYLCYYLNSLDLKPFITGGFQPKLSQGNLNAIPVPLPPLAEQQRIVAKLGQLLAHCDALEQRIQKSRRLAGQLLQTALREALAGPGGAVVAAAPEARKRRPAVGMTGDLFAAVG
jgi:type I restriction enzyme S subunit